MSAAARTAVPRLGHQISGPSVYAAIIMLSSIAIGEESFQQRYVIDLLSLARQFSRVSPHWENCAPK